jgi:two-component system, NtrC family, sensor histidine kinase PilS
MHNHLPSKIKWLLFSRILIATFLFGIAAFIEFRGEETLLSSSLRAIYYIVAIAYLTSILITFVLKKSSRHRQVIFTLGVTDLSLVTCLVHFTGGAESIYSVFYSLIVIYASLLVGKRGGNLTAGIGGLLYGLLLGFEHFGILQKIDIYRQYSLSFHQIAAKFLINAASLYIISVLSSFVVNQEKKLRSLLAEKDDAFKELNLLHRHIIESVDTGILTFDMKGRIKSFNKAASEIMCRSELDVLEKNISESFPQIKAALQSIRDGNLKRNRFEIIMPRKENVRAVIGFSISPLMNSKNERIGQIMIFQDITAFREMEQQIEKSKKMALIGEMAAGLAHEMRNPLAAMGGAIQLLRSGLKLNLTDERLMQIILRGKEQLDVFLRDFLMLARPARGDREQIDVDNMIDDILESIRFGQDCHPSIEVVKKGPGENIPISGNNSEIRQVLTNIILNAIQSMPEGGELTIQQSKVDLNGESRLSISIRDTGCGIGEEELDKIFEPFYTTKDRGTGLGLAIVSRVLESHGGQIAVESDLGIGTKIELSFPVLNG